MTDATIHRLSPALGAEVVGIDFILFRWNDLRRAKKFSRSAASRKAMKAAGVRGKPDVFFLQESAGSAT